MNTHTLHLEPGALDEVPVIKLTEFLGRYGVEVASVDGRLVIRRVSVFDEMSRPTWSDDPDPAA